MRLPGASVAIVQDDAVVYAEGFGYTSAAGNVPVEADTTLFEWGSISKLFVWVSALQLAEQGKLDLTAPISDYLPESEMPKLRFDEPITMVHLMNHTAGFEEYFVGLMSPTRDSVLPLSEFLGKHQPYQAYRPGEMVAYSNYGTSLAAYIIEKITGQSYEDYVKEHILLPLGMNDTAVTMANDADFARLQDRRATGYVSPKEGEFIATQFAYLSLYPSGGMNGPATDLAKFAAALLAKTEEDNLLFDRLETLDLLYSPTLSPSPHTPGIAHGFWEYQGTYKGYYHSGNTKGFSTIVHVVPEAGFAAVILTNQVAETAITYGLMDALLSDPAIKAQPIPLDPQIDYRATFISARNTNHTFTKLYYYLIPLTIEPDVERNLLSINFAGITGLYEQIGEHDFRLASDTPELLHMKNIRLETDGSRMVSIYAPFAGFYPTKLSTGVILISGAILLALVLYMAVMSVVYWVRRKRSAEPLSTYATTLLLQILLLANTAVLAVRVFGNPYLVMDELLVHIITSNSLGLLTILALGKIIIQAVQSGTWRTFHFLSTVMAVVLFQSFFVFWRFYSF